MARTKSPAKDSSSNLGFEADFVVDNGSMSSNQSGDCPARSAMKTPKAKPQSLPSQRDIRQKLVEADREMPSGELRFPNATSVTSTFALRRSNFAPALPGRLFYSTQIPVCLWFIARNKSGQPSTRPAGHPLSLGEGRGEGNPASVEKYEDVPGFCKSATTQDIAGHGWVLTPGRYVGAEEVEDDGEPFEEKMTRLAAELHGQLTESAKLEQAIKKNLEGLGYAR